MASVVAGDAISNRIAECFAAFLILDAFPPIQDVLIGIVENFEGDRFELTLAPFAFGYVSFSLRGSYPYYQTVVPVTPPYWLISQ